MSAATHIKVGLVGVTGYTGMELVRLLTSHPNMRLVLASSRSEAGKRLGEFYPFIEGLAGCNVIISKLDVDVVAESCDLVFLAVPHGTAMEVGAQLREKQVRVVDLSADFRIKDVNVYEKWYNTKHTQHASLGEAVYGLPELYGSDITNAKLIANPGCYPTSAILGLYPALKHGCIYADDIVIDAKSGATGAGRTANVSTLFCEVADSFRAYNIGKHRHTPEIEQELSRIVNAPITVSFNPHLLPIGRGILSTMYGKLAKEIDIASIHKIYTETWQYSPWVRVLPMGQLPETRNVRGTMFCDIGLVIDERTKRLIVISAIDNLCRGASGQAIANGNIMFGLPATTGLMTAPLMP